MARQLLFSVTAKDCRVDTFRSGGKGGQNQNKRDTGARFTHLASGAVGESREARTQFENKKHAWRRMCESPRFQSWLKIRTGQLASAVDDWMAPKFLKVETYDPA